MADLILQVNEQLALAPSFTHTDVVSASLTRVFDWGIKLDTQATRIYSETVVIKVDKLNHPRWCNPNNSNESNGFTLLGNLGLGEVIKMGLGSIDRADTGLTPASGDKSAFGTTIEFQIIKGVNASGPTWKLSSFEGPGKFFTTERNDTHKLTISFSKEADKPTATGEAIGKSSAAQNATAQNQKLNLQSLNSALRQLRLPAR